MTDSLDPELHRTFYACRSLHAGVWLRCAAEAVSAALFRPSTKRCFIDSDSLVLTNLDSFWKAFEGKYFGVPGWRVLRQGEQDPYVDVGFILKHFALDKLPKFNGGAYYFTRFPADHSLFSRRWEQVLVDYKALHFSNFRQDGPNDEAIFAVGPWQLHGLSATSMGGRGMWTPISSPGAASVGTLLPARVDLRRKAVLCSPMSFTSRAGTAPAWAYVRERARLRVHMDGGRISFPAWIALYVRGGSWDGWRKTEKTC